MFCCCRCCLFLRFRKNGFNMQFSFRYDATLPQLREVINHFQSLVSFYTLYFQGGIERGQLQEMG